MVVFFFAMFFLSEYSFILIMCCLFVSFFLGGGDFIFYMPVFNNSNFLLCFLYDIIFSIKVMFFCFCFVFIRANLPRYRFDQLLVIGWKILLPLSLSCILFYYSFFLCFDCFSLLDIPRASVGFRRLISFSTVF